MTATATISDVDQVRIEIAAEQHASRYAGLGADAAARYTAEGHLAGLCDRHGLGPVWRAVAGVIARRPELLNLEKAGREQLAARREQACKAAFEQATAALTAGDYAAAIAAVAAGQRANPDHLPVGIRTWDDLRQALTRA